MNNRSPAWYGYVPDLPDHRDLIFNPGLERIADAVDLRSGMPPVYDQGDIGSCTAHAIIAAFQFEEWRQNPAPAADYWKMAFMGSRLFLYYNERAMEGTTASDSGAMIRDGIKSVVNQGLCSESDCPYDPANFAVPPGASLYQSAQAHQAIEYRRIDASARAMMRCLSRGLPFCFGFSVYESFESEEVAKTGIVPMPGPGEAMVGGHAVLAVGYDQMDQTVIVRNSWGPDWGQAGYFTLPFSYMVSPDLCDDRWCISRVES